MCRPCCILLLATVLSGCEHFRRDEPDPAPAPSAPAPDDHLTEAEREVARLAEENRGLNERMGELRNRCDLLADKARDLQFANEQLRKQLDAVGDAPRQRDAYKAKALRMELEIERLKARIAELEQLLAPPATRPATRPATDPATRPSAAGEH